MGEANRLAAIRSWQNPEIRAKRLAKLRAIWAGKSDLARKYYAEKSGTPLLKNLTWEQLDQRDCEDNKRAAKHGLRDLQEV
jgi:hypothetical protein